MLLNNIHTQDVTVQMNDKDQTKSSAVITVINQQPIWQVYAPVVVRTYLMINTKYLEYDTLIKKCYT